MSTRTRMMHLSMLTGLWLPMTQQRETISSPHYSRALLLQSRIRRCDTLGRMFHSAQASGLAGRLHDFVTNRHE